ncbi:MAG: hypothetical protein SFZ23_13285 [Planctomycetota bacterium]|nr:hypothetical protein [Planctomycetota bacterium]
MRMNSTRWGAGWGARLTAGVVVSCACATALAAPPLENPPTATRGLRNILITGYWPPTNEMVRSWSRSPTQNPGGWQGGNWEGRGYNVMSYFPEFPGGTGTNPKGNGDFEVDYQDTAADWARVVAEVRPVAIITFSRANTSIGWEMEPATRRHRLPGEANPPGRNILQYTQDYSGNRYPSDVPIAMEPIGNIRNSTLPMQAIVDNVRAAISPTLVDPFIPAYNPANPDAFDFGGAFLSGYIGYLGSWYRDQNINDSFLPCFAAGHVHVGRNMTVSAATQATQVTLRTLTDYLDGVVPSPGVTVFVVAGLMGFGRRRRSMAK